MRPCRTTLWPSLSVWILSRSTHYYLRSFPRVIICQTVGQTRVISAGSDKDILRVLGDNSVGSNLLTQAQKALHDQVLVYFPSLFPQCSSFRVCRKMSPAEFLMIHVSKEIAQFHLDLPSFSCLPGSSCSYELPRISSLKIFLWFSLSPSANHTPLTVSCHDLHNPSTTNFLMG